MGSSFQGEVPLEIGGQTYRLRLTWEAHAQLVDAFGGDYALPDQSNVKALAQAVSILTGGAISSKDVYKASPPLVPTLAAVEKALLLGFRGPEEAQEEGAEKGTDPFPERTPGDASRSPRNGRTRRASAPPNSGG